MTASTARVGRRQRPDRRRAAAWTLVVLAPLCAEASYTGIMIPAVWLALPLLVPFYGGGILLLRELVRRTGAGWPGLLLLGVAFEVAEDGLALQGITSPHLYTAAEWGPRVAGVNTVYWQSQLTYHLVFTVLIPVVLTEMIFRGHGSRPYVGRAGLIGAAVAFVLGGLLVRVAVAGTEDPGYQAPWPVVAGLLVLMAVLAVLALVVLPRLRRRGRWPAPAPVAAVPRPVAAAAFAAVVVLVCLGLVWPLGTYSGHPAVGTGSWVWVPMAVSLALALAAGRRVARWVATPGFDDHHRVWLIGGALVGHSLFALAGGVVGGSTALSVPIAIVVVAATVVLLARLARRLPEPARP